MRMIRWMCGIKVTDRVTCGELSERLELLSIQTHEAHIMQTAQLISFIEA